MTLIALSVFPNQNRWRLEDDVDDVDDDDDDGDDDVDGVDSTVSVFPNRNRWRLEDDGSGHLEWEGFGL